VFLKKNQDKIQMASLVEKQEMISEKRRILEFKKSAYQTADDADAENVMDLYDEYQALKKIVLEMEAQIAKMKLPPLPSPALGGGSGGGGGGGGGSGGGGSGGGGSGGGAHWANDDKSEITEPVVVPPTPIVDPPTPVVVPPTPVVVPPTPVVVPPTPVVVPPTPVVVPPTPVVVPPTKDVSFFDVDIFFAALVHHICCWSHKCVLLLLICAVVPLLQLCVCVCVCVCLVVLCVSVCVVF